MDLHTAQDGAIGRLTIRGEVDFYNASEIGASLKEFMAGGTYRFIVDLAGVPYMDSTGVATFIGVLHTLREKGGGIVFLSAQKSLVQVFELIQMKSHFAFCDSEAAARAACSGTHTNRTGN